MRAVYQKELKSYFFTPTGWLFLAVFLAISGLVFFLNNIITRSSDFTPFLSMMSYVWMLLTPLLVMRLLAGEKRLQTDSLLRSSPLSVSAIIAGKYLAACTVLLCAVLLSLVYPAMIAAYARVYPAELLTGYLGFLLQGCAFIALDLMVTASLGNTVTAAAVAFGVNLLVWLVSLLSSAVTIPPAITATIAFFSLYGRFVPYLSAQLSFANTLFYLLFILCTLSVSVLIVHSERNRRT